LEKALGNGSLPIVIRYRRVSSDDQVSEGHSLEVQEDRVRNLVESKFPKGYRLLDVCDEAMSGTLHYKSDSSGKAPIRPGLKAVCSLICTGKVQAIAVYKLDRLARELSVWADFVREYVRPYQVQLLTCDGTVELDSPGSEFAANILMAFNKYECDLIVKRSTDGLHKRMDEGYTLGSPPFGWQRSPANKKAAMRSGLCPHPTQSPIVQRVFTEFVGGIPLTTICERLNEDGSARPGAGLAPWTPTWLRKVLRQPVHAGWVRDHQGKPIEGAHFGARIVEPETFEKAQVLLKRVGRLRGQVRMARTILSGILRCRHCDSPIGSSGVHYLCRKCGSKSRALAAPIDRYVREVLSEVCTGDDFADAVVSQCRDLLAHEVTQAQARKRQLTNDLEEARANLRSWAKRLHTGEIRQAGFEVVQEEFEDDQARLLAELGANYALLARLEPDSAAIRECLTRLLPGSRRIAQLDASEARELAELLIDRAELELTQAGTLIRVSLITGYCRQTIFERAVLPRRRPTRKAVLAVAVGVARGMTHRQIAEARGVCLQTVKKQISAIPCLCPTNPGVSCGTSAQPDNTSDPSIRDGRREGSHRWGALERLVLKRLDQGLSTWQIASELKASERSVRAARERICRKLGCHGKEVVPAARALGLLPESPVPCKVTPRENLLLQRLILIRSVRQAASELQMGMEAARSAIRRLRKKYGARSLRELLQIASSEGGAS